MANNPQFSGMQPLQPPFVGSMDPPRNFAPPPPMPVQFRPVVPPQPPQQFIPVASPHFQPVGRGVPLMNAGVPPQPPQPQFPHPMSQLPARPNQPGHVLPPPQAIQLPNPQPNRPVMSGSAMPPPGVQTPNNYMPGLGGPGVPVSSSYTFAPPSYGQPPVTFNTVTQYQPVSQMHSSTIPAVQPVLSSVNQSTAPVTPVQHSGELSSAPTVNVLASDVQPKPTEEASTEWKEHVQANGRRFYYNKRTRQSVWEKPFELMTPIERADATTDWKEFTSPDGRKYYYNKVSKQSKWLIPEELKLARKRVEQASVMGIHSETFANPHASTSVDPSVDKILSSADASSFTAQEAPLSPVPVIPIAAGGNLHSQSASESSTLQAVSFSMAINVDEVRTTVSPVVDVPASVEDAATVVDAITAPMNNNSPAEELLSSVDKVPAQEKQVADRAPAQEKQVADKAPAQEKQEDEKDVAMDEKITNVSSEEKAVNQEPLLYADKLEAKNAFKALLESANVGSDWTWDQAMRVIINDRRYGALRTLGERKQAFNEFLGQKRKQEAEERRIKQKKARDEFKNMLEESKEVTASMRWSKVMAIFENDDRFKAVERERDRRDLIETYLEELSEKERAKAQEERKRNIREYRQFLESCDFIKASSQWRKLQDRLEADERCSRLEKMDRLEIFQDYLRDLEKEEDEQRKIQKEELRKTERKNRDEFRKLLEEHAAAGSLTAKTNWHDYAKQVEHLPAYLAIASNTSGSTAKNLFDDVAEELLKRYHEVKTRIKDVVKLKKIPLASTWTLEDFKAAVKEDVSSPPISDMNLKMVFDDLLERAREKEEKEAKKRKRLADDFFNLLQSIKEITASSKWESCKEIVEGTREFSSIGEDGFCKEIFEDYITQLKEQEMENERKRKEEKAKREKEREERERRKAKHRREKERGHEREKEHSKKEETDAEIADAEETRSSNENSRKQRKRHQNAADDLNESEKDRSKSSHRHGGDHKKSRRHASTPESDSESRHKRHKRDHRSASRRIGDHEELEDGEFGEDGETR